MALTIDSKIKDILASEQAKAILEKHLPGSTSHPDLPMAMYMSLREASTYPESGSLREKLDAIAEDFKCL
jgi:hypothetical protein